MCSNSEGVTQTAGSQRRMPGGDPGSALPPIVIASPAESTAHRGFSGLVSARRVLPLPPGHQEELFRGIGVGPDGQLGRGLSPSASLCLRLGLLLQVQNLRRSEQPVVLGLGQT